MNFRRCFVLLSASLAFSSSAGAAAPANIIQKENAQPGTTAWQLTNPADGDRQIEGYASLTSVSVGGEISLFVNTADKSYSLTVYRMGWYGGKGGRKVLGPQTLKGIRQPMPSAGPGVDVVECEWTNPFTIHVPSSWVSGIYLAKLHGNTSGRESYITFTVRDSRRADLVFQQSVMTYQAYNGWPGSAFLGGSDGYSLYNVDSNGLQVPRVSFNRPYGTYPVDDPFYTPPMYLASQFAEYGVGAGDLLNHGAPAAMEYGMLRWLEHEGYDVTYITDVDTHEDAGRLLRGKGYLSVGHDEYWSERMRTNVIQARGAGVSLGFFGANYLYWAVDLLPDSGGNPNRTIALVDPTKSCTFTCMGEPEQGLTGGNWVGSVPTNGDIVIDDDVPLDHWAFANTGLEVGNVIPGLIGAEYNGIDPSFGTPPGLQTLVHTQAPRFEEGLVNANGGFPIPDGFDLDFNAWYEQMAAFVAGGGALSTVCDTSDILRCISRPCRILQECLASACVHRCESTRAMTICQVGSRASGLQRRHEPAELGTRRLLRAQYRWRQQRPAVAHPVRLPWFHPDVVSCRNPAIELDHAQRANRFILGQWSGRRSPASLLTECRSLRPVTHAVNAADREASEVRLELLAQVTCRDR
jgi:hypothetical protein